MHCAKSFNTRKQLLFQIHSFEVDILILASSLVNYLSLWVGAHFRPFHTISYRFDTAIIDFPILDIYTYQKITLNLTAL